MNNLCIRCYGKHTPAGTHAIVYHTVRNKQPLPVCVNCKKDLELIGMDATQMYDFLLACSNNQAGLMENEQ